jgi:putative transposase
LIQPEPSGPSLRRQCALLGVSRGCYYYAPRLESAENLVLMRRLDELHLQHPVYGSRRLAAHLRRHGWSINRKRVQRLMDLMGLEALYAKPHTSQPGDGHEIYPYLLKDKVISGPDQVWCADITYIPMKLGFLYLVAFMDWWSRFVLAWQISNTLDTRFCIQGWQAALKAGNRSPLIANTDQGAQFTATDYLAAVERAGTRVSMDGRRRWVDNVFIERVWRSFKYEDVYLRDYADGDQLHRGAHAWFTHYNTQRPHQALGYATPAELYFSPESYGARPANWVQRVGLQEYVL